MAYDPLVIVTLSLLALIAVTALVLKMNAVLVSGIGTVSAIAGGVGSYLLCVFLFPEVSATTCATIGAIASMWSSVLTLYLGASLQQQGIALHISLG